MNLRRLIAEARELLDDELEPYLHSDTAMKRWANDAVLEASLRARLLVDSTTTAVCSIAVTATANYRLHASIMVARRIEYVSSEAGAIPRPLERTTTDILDRTMPGWQALTSRDPDYVIQDLQQRTLRLVPTPSGSGALGTLTLTAFRTPLDSEEMVSMSDEPAIAVQHHRGLVHWMVYRAASRSDAETRDTKLAGEQYALFEAQFGALPNAAHLQELAIDPTGEIESHWF